MKVSPENIHLALKQPLSKALQNKSVQESNPTLGDTFAQMLDEANQQQLRADEKKEAFLTGENKDIHGTMIELEKAEISMKLLLQIRTKLMTAYEEVMRMQV